MTLNAEVREALEGKFSDCRSVGSRVTCSPIPSDSDEDWLFLSEDIHGFVHAAEQIGFEAGGSMIDCYAAGACDFISLKRENEDVTLNLIVTQSSEFKRRFIVATNFAKRMNLLKKEDRISLFQAVLYGNTK